MSQSISFFPSAIQQLTPFLGNCKPVQWVPDKYCHQNFFNMCVNMNKNNKARAKYGNGGCQDWHIKQF